MRSTSIKQAKNKIKKQNTRHSVAEKISDGQESLVTNFPYELVEEIVNNLDYCSAWKLAQVNHFFRNTLLNKGSDKKNMLEKLFDHDGIFAATYHAIGTAAYKAGGEYVCPTPKAEIENPGEKKSDTVLFDQAKPTQCLFEASIKKNGVLPVFPLLPTWFKQEAGYFHWIMALQHIIFNLSLSKDIRLMGVYFLLTSVEHLGVLPSYFKEALQCQYGDEKIVEQIKSYVQGKYPTLSIVFAQEIPLIIRRSIQYYKKNGYENVEDSQKYWQVKINELLSLTEEKEPHFKYRCIVM